MSLNSLRKDTQMKVIINGEGKYLIPGKEPFPSFTDDENDQRIYFDDNIASLVSTKLGLRTVTKNFYATKKICLRCEHRWTTRKKDPPIICPKCKSPYWNTPLKNKK